MSQAEIFNIIRELGGHATKDNIRQRAKEKYPQLTLHKYVYDRLLRLQIKGLIKYNPYSEEWYIAKNNIIAITK